MIVAGKRGFAGPLQRQSGKFFVDCQDCMLLGPDSELEEAMFANYLRWIETGDDYLPAGRLQRGMTGNLSNGTARYGS